MLVSYAKPNVHRVFFGEHAESLMLVPGVNEVDPKLWKDAQSHPDVKKMLDDGVLNVESSAEPSQEKPGLSELSLKDATKIVKKTLNLELLQEWKYGETRAAVLKEIDVQIKYINEKTKPKKSSGDED